MTQTILKDIKEIKKDLKYIKEHMVDIDTILTKDDKRALENARKEFKEGKTTSLEDLKKHLNL